MDVLVAMIENKVRFFVPKSNKDTYTFGNTEHHPNIHSLVRDGKKIELTILENRILLHFLQNKERDITREELMEVVWGYSSNVNTRTLDMHVVRLRKKIENNPDKPTYLQTVRGLGYKFFKYCENDRRNIGKLNDISREVETHSGHGLIVTAVANTTFVKDLEISF
jgi:two-component system response regulator MtrA